MDDNSPIKVLVVGHGGCGKGTVCNIMKDFPCVYYCGSTSEVISEVIAKEMGLSFQEAHSMRNINDESRMKWYHKGREICGSNPSKLLELCYKRVASTEDEPVILVADGCRDNLEIFDAISRDVVDVIVWVERPGIPKDPSLKFGSEVANYVIYNDSDIDSLKTKIGHFFFYLILFGGHHGRP